MPRTTKIMRQYIPVDHMTCGIVFGFLFFLMVSYVPIIQFVQGAENIVKCVGSDLCSGTEMDDVIIGNNASNIMTGLDGADVMLGWDGDDSMSGGNRTDQMIGDEGDDKISGGDGSDEIFMGYKTYQALKVAWLLGESPLGPAARWLGGRVPIRGTRTTRRVARIAHCVPTGLPASAST